MLLDHNWSDTASEKDGNSAPTTPGFFGIANPKGHQPSKTQTIENQPGQHEYHEISDDESPGFDLGPSLVDEVLRALGGSSHTGHSSKDFDWKEEKAISSLVQSESKRGTLKDTLRKKHSQVGNVFCRMIEDGHACVRL